MRKNIAKSQNWETVFNFNFDKIHTEMLDRLVDRLLINGTHPETNEMNGTRNEEMKKKRIC